MFQMVACIVAYIAVALFTTGRLAFLVGKHRGLHARDRDIPAYRIQSDGRWSFCPHPFCDCADVPILYFLALVATPFFLLLVAARKFTNLFKKAGFNSVQLPANSHPGIEITEVRLKKVS